jgi:calcium homeostasis endoplasmic reticulum protein
MAQQQQSQAEEAIRQAQEEKLCVMAEEVGIDCTELNNLLHPIISSCTKDAISQGKAWILGKSQSNSMINPVIALQLLLRYHFLNIFLCLLHYCCFRRSTEPNAPFSQKLHIIYLINDVLHNW